MFYFNWFWYILMVVVTIYCQGHYYVHHLDQPEIARCISIAWAPVRLDSDSDISFNLSKVQN